LKKLMLTGHESTVKTLAKRADSLMGLVVVGILALFILPLPVFVIDMMIAMSIASGVMLLALAMYTPTALSLSTFPSLLLLSTIFRFAVSIASIKLILGGGHAGHIIEAFGNLVVGGSVVVGLVVFIVIALVQFLVISKGSERVAEVSARFTLDGMPGKQMSIDADLRAGAIDREQAKQRRVMLERESQMHGSMDGAMKFVKNDAIATLIVAFVNMVAGIGIGIGSRGMGFSEALSRYTLLTVGDAMVAQVPSLLTSLAAGVLITRVSTSDEPTRLGQQIGEQVLEQPAALALGACVVGAFCLVPGFPLIPFLSVAVVCAAVAIYVHRSKAHVGDIRNMRSEAMMREGGLRPQLMVDENVAAVALPLQLRLSPEDVRAIAPQRFNQRLEAIRNRVRLEIGLPFPGLSMKFDTSIPNGTYAIDVQEIVAERGEFKRINQSEDIETYLAERIAHVMRQRADAFVGMQEVQSMLQRAALTMPDLVVEVQKACPLQRTAEVLRRLAQEQVSLRYQREIFESIATWAPREKDIVMLVERVRVDLGRLIVNRFSSEGRLTAYLLDGLAEKMIRESIQVGLGGGVLALPPDAARSLTASANKVMASAKRNTQPTLLTSMEVRRYALKLYGAKIPGLVALSFQELPPDTDVEVLGRFGIEPAEVKRVA
jgi:type III secretion protein V